LLNKSKAQIFFAPLDYIVVLGSIKIRVDSAQLSFCGSGPPTTKQPDTPIIDVISYLAPFSRYRADLVKCSERTMPWTTKNVATLHLTVS